MALEPCSGDREKEIEVSHPKRESHDQVGDLLYYAQHYLEKGWPLIPIYGVRHHACLCRRPSCRSPGKHPACPRGVLEATQDRCILTRLRRNPELNLAVRTGQASGLVVIDVDDRHGGTTSLQQWEREFGSIPRSSTVRTGGGMHIYLRSSEVVRSRVGVLPGIDVRAEGGYVVVPPSRHVAGRKYEWIAMGDVPLLPSALSALLQGSLLLSASQREQKDKCISGSAKLPAASPPDQECVGEGLRNSFLTSVGGLLRRHGLPETHIRRVLLGVNNQVCQPPLEPEEIAQVSLSVARYGSGTPPWPDPGALPSVHERAPSLESDMLPPALTAWLCDQAERLQVPLEFIAAPAMVAISGVVGRQVAVCPMAHDDWRVIPNLWGFIVAPPGSLKSPAMAAAFRPLDKLVKQAQKRYQAEQETWQLAQKERAIQMEALREKIRQKTKLARDLDDIDRDIVFLSRLESETPVGVTERRFLTNDATVEKIAELMAKNPRGLTLYRDELRGWFEQLYKPGREDSRAFFLETWNGDASYSVDRIGRGSLHVPAMCLAIFGGLQPSSLDAMLAKQVRAGEDGLLPRFQMIFYPEVSEGRRILDREPDKAAIEQVEHLFESLSQLADSEFRPNSDTVPCLRLESSAQKYFYDWLEDLENRISRIPPKHDLMRAILGKQRSLLPSLGLLFFLVDAYTQVKPHYRLARGVGQESLERAARWCKLLEEHARKVFTPVLDESVAGALRLAGAIREGDLGDGAKCRDIYRRHWAGLDTPQRLDQAIDVLSKINWVRKEKVRSSGGTTEIVHINPKVQAR